MSAAAGRRPCCATSRHGRYPRPAQPKRACAACSMARRLTTRARSCARMMRTCAPPSRSPPPALALPPPPRAPGGRRSIRAPDFIFSAENSDLIAKYRVLVLRVDAPRPASAHLPPRRAHLQVDAVRAHFCGRPAAPPPPPRPLYPILRNAHRGICCLGGYYGRISIPMRDKSRTGILSTWD